MAIETTIYNPVHFLNRAMLNLTPRFSGDVYLALGEVRDGGDGIGKKFAEPDSGQTRKQLIVANRTITWDESLTTYTYLYDEGESFTMFATDDWDVEATAFALFDAATGGNILNYGASGQDPGVPTNGTRFCIRTVRCQISREGSTCGHEFFLSVIELVYGDGEFLPALRELDLITITTEDATTETCAYSALGEPLELDSDNIELLADLITFRSTTCIEAPWSAYDMAVIPISTSNVRRAAFFVDGLIAWHAFRGQGDLQNLPDNADRCHWYLNKGELEFTVFPGPGYAPI